MKRDEMNETPSRIPESSNTKAMDSKKDVEKSADPLTDQDFPGYPHYPAKEDIMDQRSGNHRVDADVEGMAAGRNATGLNQRYAASQERRQSGSEEAPAEGEGSAMDATDSTPEERGNRQNVDNDDVNLATETGSLNP